MSFQEMSMINTGNLGGISEQANGNLILNTTVMVEESDESYIHYGQEIKYP